MSAQRIPKPTRTLLGIQEPTREVGPTEARRSIDDLVAGAHRYRSSSAYTDLLHFAGRFRRYSPFNALLIHLQRPGATYVAPAHRWDSEHGHRVKPGEQPLVALQPFGPVMFVYDVSQTESVDRETELPLGVSNPFAMPPLTGIAPALDRLVNNAQADGVRITLVPSGSQSAGCISTAGPGLSHFVQAKFRPPGWVEVPIRYDVRVNDSFTHSEQFATIAHELGHLYCGHLGTPNANWWPDRSDLPEEVEEFEAESVAFIACQRIDETAQMPPHLAHYLDNSPDVPDGLSLERVTAAAGRVIDMSHKRLKPREG